jgi:uncharacterized membrane-anchored protein YhcB (DUF1043 family)
VFKTTDVRAADGMDLVRVYLSTAAGNATLRNQVNELLKLQKETANVEQQIETTREQMQEYRSRMDELHAQILTLREVRTGAALLKALEKKMQDISDKVSGATIALVNLQEKLMISKVHFQDAVAELTLETPASNAPPPSTEARRLEPGSRPDEVRCPARSNCWGADAAGFVIGLAAHRTAPGRTGRRQPPVRHARRREARRAECAFPTKQQLTTFPPASARPQVHRSSSSALGRVHYVEAGLCRERRTSFR